ncbi:MAG: MFS transporter [Patescibacteria group bacterium]
MTIIPRGLSEILKNRHFLKLWISQVLSMTAGDMLTFLLAIRIYQLTNNNFIVSVYIALVGIPPVIFSVIAGAYADNHNRKKILAVSNLLRVGILFLFLIFHGNPYLLMALAFSIATVSQFFGPAESATIPNLVRRDQYYLANSMFMFTNYIAFLIGYSLAGPALFYLKDQTIFIVLLLMYIVAFTANYLLPSQKHHLLSKKEMGLYGNAFKKIFHDILEGFKILKNNKPILFSIIQMAVVFSAERAVVALFPDLAAKYFHYSVADLSYYLVLPVGIGAFAGAILINKVKKIFPKRKIINWSLIIDGLVLLAIPFYYFALHLGPLYLKAATCFAGFTSGLVDVFIIVTAQTLIHETSADESRGRIFGNLMGFVNLVNVPVVLLVGFLASFFRVTTIIGIVGLVVTIFGLSCRYFYKRNIKPETNSISTQTT